MENKEILDMCRRLARRYRNRQDYDDLVSEGVVKCLDLRAGGEKNPAALYYSAREAMFYFANVGSSQLTYPKGRMGKDAKKSDTSIYIAVDDSEVEYELETTEDIFGSYEVKNILQTLGDRLTDAEKEVLVSLWNNNNNLVDTDRDLNKTKQSIDRHRNNIRRKVETICDVD